MRQSLRQVQIQTYRDRDCLGDIPSLINEASDAYKINDLDNAMNLALNIDQRLYERNTDILSLNYK